MIKFKAKQLIEPQGQAWGHWHDSYTNTYDVRHLDIQVI